jgi:hypothetical protein
MKQKDLPERWLIKLQNHLKETGSKYNELSANDFRYNLKIQMSDGSNTFFHYAFYWIDENLKEVAVFTEHCGYHILTLIDTKLELIDSQNNVIKTDDYRIN